MTPVRNIILVPYVERKSRTPVVCITATRKVTEMPDTVNDQAFPNWTIPNVDDSTFKCFLSRQHPLKRNF